MLEEYNNFLEDEESDEEEYIRCENKIIYNDHFIKNKPERFLVALKELGEPDPLNWYGFMKLEYYISKHSDVDPPLPKYITVPRDDMSKEDFDRSIKEGKYPYRCLCGNHYKTICYFVCKTIPNLAVCVGACCVKKSLPIENRCKRCVRCNLPYKGGVYDNCKKCREAIKEEERQKEIIEKQKEIIERKKREEQNIIINSFKNKMYIITFGKYKHQNFLMNVLVIKIIAIMF